MSASITLDVLECLNSKEPENFQIIALKPLIIDIKKVGLKLIEDQNNFTKIIYKYKENEIRLHIKNLSELEKMVLSFEKKFINHLKEVTY